MMVSISVTSLPENVVLEIFSYLTIPQRCQVARVCRLWSQLIRDKYLWRYVDLTANPIPPKILWKVVRGYLSDSLRSLSLHGFLYSIKGRECITHALLREISVRCPKLVSMQILCANMSAIESNKFPQNLQRLYLEHCELSPHWLKSAVESSLQVFDSLQELSFNESKRLSDVDIPYVSKLTNLKALNLNNCYRISDEGVKKLTNDLIQLETLVLSGCSITDLAIHFVSHRLKNIQTLDVSRCTSLTNAGLRILGVPYYPKYLKVLGCKLLDTDLAKLMKGNSEFVSIEFGQNGDIKIITQTNFKEFLEKSDEENQQ